MDERLTENVITDALKVFSIWTELSISELFLNVDPFITHDGHKAILTH